MSCYDSSSPVPRRFGHPSLRGTVIVDGSDEASQGSWGALLRLCRALRPRSGRTRLASEDGRRSRESLFPAAFACSSHCLPVPQSTPWSLFSPPRGASVLSPPYITTRTPTSCKLSGLNRTASALAVYASQLRVAPTPRKTRFPAGGQPLPGGLDFPLGLHRSFCHVYMTSPSPGFAWRNTYTYSLFHFEPPHRSRRCSSSWPETIRHECFGFSPIL